jgi:protein involved in polysaccharide export with SLBB domain
MSVPVSVAPPGSCDVAVSAGVFTPGHVPATALGQLVTLVRAGGAVIVSTRHQYVIDVGFDQEVVREVEAGRVDLLEHVPSAPYSIDDTAQ